MTGTIEYLHTIGKAKTGRREYNKGNNIREKIKLHKKNSGHCVIKRS